MTDTNIITPKTAETQGENYCPSCGISWTILGDMLHSKGHGRQGNKSRKAAARAYLRKCSVCTEFFKDGKK